MSGSAAAIAMTALLAAGSCMPLDEPSTVPTPAADEPQLRVGLFDSISRPIFAADGGLQVLDPEEGEVTRIAPSAEVAAMASGDLVSLDVGVRPLARRVVILSPLDAGAPIRINGRPYRGTVELRRGGDGVQVINRVGLEAYLVGVVGAEMGRRAPGEEAALEAQAVASRTYALKRMAESSAAAYDLVATVNAQVYGGMTAENSMARAAVEATHGEVLTWRGALIDAFYSSTCGGRSETASAVFVGGDRPYLHSQPDLAPDGTPWCAISPRYHWQERWTSGQLTGILRRSLANEGLPTARAGDLRDIQVLDRTPSGRIATIALVGAGGTTAVRGSAIRRVLETTAGGLLWSADFTIRISRLGGRIERVEAVGRGSGHAVGMCQWGAIGRARAGQDHRTILMSYFPGTELTTLY